MRHTGARASAQTLGVKNHLWRNHMPNEQIDEPEGPKPGERSQASVKSPWNSLELSKLVVGALTPALIFWYGQQVISEREKAAEASEKYTQVVKKRVELWDKLAGHLNDIYCYFLYVGHWKALAQPDIVSKKRELDKLVYANRPFFS